MTDTQLSILDEITEKMREHFDAAVLIIEVDAGDDNDPTLSNLSFRTAGTFSQGLGLVECAKHKMLHDA